MRAVEREVRLPRRLPQALRLLWEQGELGSHRPDRHGGEGEEVDAELRELGQQLVRFSRLVLDGAIEVVHPTDPESHLALPYEDHRCVGAGGSSPWYSSHASGAMASVLQQRRRRLWVRRP